MINIGKIVGWYFISLALFQIFVFLVNYFQKGFINVDLTFIINFVLGIYLMRHNNKARKLAIIFSAIGIFVNVILLIMVTIVGLTETFHFALLGVNISIKNITLFGNVVEILNIRNIQSLIVTSMLLSAIPFAILISEKADKEFTINSESV